LPAATGKVPSCVWDFVDDSVAEIVAGGVRLAISWSAHGRKESTWA
jgi:hypothetical protein